ncbi:integrin alpha-9-like isoform X1 [Maniola jurtina]|uniref:integrin alpha-9-like isoform X1 n=2 Tax=Maniola jurtina TaxID=191418 RepID=UPI001E68FD16|nr:integrin alpha-9-like isoform X1 [Maniola jurtina]
MLTSSVLCSVLLVNILFCECSSIFHENSKIFYHPDKDSEYFGYSVILSNQRLIVGAPKAKSSLNRRITSGEVFKCPVQDLDTYHNVSCLPIGVGEEIEDRIFARSFGREELFKDDMWFGATLSATPNGAVFICAPRWTKPYKNTHLLQNGMCYMLSSRMGKEYLPLLDPRSQAFLSDDRRPEYGEFGTNLNYYAYGQAGFSVKVSETGVILGAPGLLQWTGGVVEYRPIDKNFKNSYLSKQTTINPYYTKELGPDDYLGYSVESGIFERNGTNLIVAGAPRSHHGYGQVLIFEPSIRESSPLNIKYRVVGDQLGSYFGATLCCTDVNGDGMVDLLVGAPNYVRKDGILHYDQGAVFVYLTNTQGVNFTLDAASYVSGTEESGARFGSSIADLGDIDGDGFNDIAIGAPWEDEGKGAVYIYRGGKKGLNKQYDQRIVVAESKTFGYSISKGVDMDDNNCNDFAVGAYNISAAYIFRCIPTVHVNVSIRVPDAVNLPVNATNFTALFCVKSTPRTAMKREASLMKSDFTARIAVDTKENRARFEGDTEYDLSITAGNEKCDEQIVVVKPTADLSKPISIKFNLEDNGSLEDSKDFPSYGARVSADSVLETSFDIQLRRDCGEDLICKPLLKMSLEPLNTSRVYIPGTDDRLGFKVSVINEAEPSYGAKVHLTLPSSPKRLPSECSLEELVVTCHLPAPLARSESVEWEIELEYTYRDSATKTLQVVATLENPLYDDTDIDPWSQYKNLSIYIRPEAKFSISGKALPNATIVVTREKFNEASNVTLVHYYEVTNFGPSDWFWLAVQVLFPEKVNLSSHIKGCQLGVGQALECTWDLPAQVSLPIALPLRFDLGLYGDFLYENSNFNVTTTILILQEGRNITESITTVLTLEPAAPIWPYIVGGVTGLLLLLVMISIFYKYGFFSRNRPGDFKKLEEHETAEEASSSGTNVEDTRSVATADEASSCGAAEPSFMNETSSMELLADDS